MEDQDRYENEPESGEDVEGHRFRSDDDPEQSSPGLQEDEDVEAHQFTPGQHSPGQHSPGQHSPGQHSPGQHSPGAADL